MELEKNNYYFNEKDGKIYFYVGFDKIKGVLIMIEVLKDNPYVSPKSNYVKFQQETAKYFHKYENYLYKLLKILKG